MTSMLAVSQTLAERVVREAAKDDILVANGFSCRERVKQNSLRSAVHIAEVRAARIDEVKD
jgi:hypothetical protein